MAIFHSYVSLPEGRLRDHNTAAFWDAFWDAKICQVSIHFWEASANIAPRQRHFVGLPFSNRFSEFLWIGRPLDAPWITWIIDVLPYAGCKQWSNNIYTYLSIREYIYIYIYIFIYLSIHLFIFCIYTYVSIYNWTIYAQMYEPSKQLGHLLSVLSQNISLGGYRSTHVM